MCWTPYPRMEFINVRPGLVGGHCIGGPILFDLQGEAVGHYPEMILAGRRINESMSTHIVTKLLRLLLERMLRFSMLRF